jgi:KDO2-lipid IV(A) lauroyltransferase
MFAHRLEQTIRREPAYWLWSHKRWKLTKEEADQLEQEELNKKKE